jgi:hypothetical protein
MTQTRSLGFIEPNLTPITPVREPDLPMRLPARLALWYPNRRLPDERRRAFTLTLFLAEETHADQSR